MALLFDHLNFAYDSSPTDLIRDLTAHIPTGWTGVVGVNGAGKTTLLELATGRLTPVTGSVRRRDPAVYCAQRTAAAPAELPQFAADLGARAHTLRRQLGVDDEWSARWATLSHGERKRAQLAVALWAEPAVLAVDEPTNHLDEDATRLIAAALKAYRGVGLLVSHDRALLDALCTQCIFFEGSGSIRLRPGNYSCGDAERQREIAHVRREHDVAAAELNRLRREQTARRAAADAAHGKRSGRDLERHDSDGRERLRLAILSGKDGRAGRSLKQIERRVDRARESVDALRPQKLEHAGIWLHTEPSPRATLVSSPGGRLELGPGRQLTFPALALGPTDRVALTGPNGSGKSSLVRHILERLQSQPHGVPAERLVYIPQEISAGECVAALAAVKATAAHTRGRLMAVVSRLNSQPQRLLDSRLPSPGEARKLLFTLGVVRTPYIVIMDEPTNHLDLPAIQCLEDALIDIPCALLLVSHDRRFLGRLCQTEWRLRPSGDAVDLEVRRLEGR